MNLRNLTWALLAALALLGSGCWHNGCGCGGSSLRPSCPPGGAIAPPPPPPSGFGSVSEYPVKYGG